MKSKLFLLLAIIACLSLTSCYSSQLYVGGMNTNEPATVLASKNNHHFLLGLISPSSNKQNIEKYVGDRQKYAIKSNRTFFNLFLEVITCGIYAPSKTTFYIPVNENK